MLNRCDCAASRLVPAAQFQALPLRLAHYARAAYRVQDVLDLVNVAADVISERASVTPSR